MSPLWVLIGGPVAMLILSFCCGLMAAIGWRAGRALPRSAGTATTPPVRPGAKPPLPPPDAWVTRSRAYAAPLARPVDTPTEELRPYALTPPHAPWSPERNRR